MAAICRVNLLDSCRSDLAVLLQQAATPDQSAHAWVEGRRVTQPKSIVLWAVQMLISMLKQVYRVI